MWGVVNVFVYILKSGYATNINNEIDQFTLRKVFSREKGDP